MAIINTSMTPLKHAIFNELRARHTDMTEFTDEELNGMIFHHSDGLRLSMTGFIRIKAIFTAYSFELPEEMKSKHRFGMSKMEYPYFFTKRRLILFSEMDAMVVKIHGGIEGFLEMYSQVD